MSKIYIVQSYNTNESDFYNLNPCYIENIVCNDKNEAEKIADFITDYNARITGENDLICSEARVVEIDLNGEFSTLKNIKKLKEG